MARSSPPLNRDLESGDKATLRTQASGPVNVWRSVPGGAAGTAGVVDADGVGLPGEDIADPEPFLRVTTIPTAIPMITRIHNTTEMMIIQRRRLGFDEDGSSWSVLLE